MTISEEFQQKLMKEVGLSKQQVSSRTTEVLVNHFMPNEGKILIQEARQQVAEIHKEAVSLQRKYWQLQEEIKSIADTVVAIKEAQEEYGCVTDDRAKNVLAFYAALLGMNKKAGAPAKESVESAGHIVYAYLGGQAKRDIHYNDPIGVENLPDNQ